MTTKPKSFPLPLSAIAAKPLRGAAATVAVIARAGGKIATGKLIATPQTATRNAASYLARPAAGITARQDFVSTNGRTTPTVSVAVRQAMVMRIAKQGVQDQKVLAAMGTVPRHMFLESGFVSQAYIDASLPIGYQQTISQPYIVARMIEVLRANKEGGVLNRVLEIGTGCGYQAAVLSLVAKEVYSIERIKPLHELARSNLRPLRIANIRLHYGDGMLGFPQVAPFDGIILAAAGMEVPQTLLGQLTIGGRLVAPVGDNQQVLKLIERVGPEQWITTTLEACHFVPLRPGITG